jgi:hypothetical protein
VPTQHAQVRFFEVSESELEDLRSRFTSGQYNIDIEAKTFSMAEYNQMIGSEWHTICALCCLL